MKRVTLVQLLSAAVVMWAAPARSQSALTLEAVAARLEHVEQENAELREQLKLLQQEVATSKQADSAPSSSATARIEALEEKVDVNAGRLSEQEQVKVEGSQRGPLRVTGMVLFNVYGNGRHAGMPDYPGAAVVSRRTINANSGASLRGSIFGLSFNSPEAVMGGQLHGSVLLDLFGDEANSGQVLTIHPRLRIASVEGQWGTRSVLVGQDKVIFSPREPNSLARVAVSPLSGSGNLYGWRPQVRFEQRVGLGAHDDVRAQIGVVETFEDWNRTQPEFVSTLELRRPAFEGHFQFGHRFDDERRFEIGSGFHRSATHVAGTSVPSTIVSVDGFIKPLPWLELTGFAFSGKNVAQTSGRMFYGVTIRTPRPGVIQAIPVREWGGWAQATFLATPRLSFNVQRGLEDPNDDDLLAIALARNATYVANAYYRIAPNVIGGFEVAQVRTRYKAGQHPQNNHFDLYLAYMF